MYEPAQPEQHSPHECLEWCPICRGAEVLRATASPELMEQLQQVQRGALVSMRALIDAYLERLDEEPAAAEPGPAAGGAEPATGSAPRGTADPRSSG